MVLTGAGFCRLRRAFEKAREWRLTAKTTDEASPRRDHGSKVSFSAWMSASTMSLTSPSNVTVGFQPSCARALLASPRRMSTSLGRK